MPAHRNPLISPLHQSPIRRVTDNVFVSPLPATAHHHSGSSSCPISPVSRSSQSIRIQYTSATVTNDLKALNSMMANHRGGGSGRNWNNAAPAGSGVTKRVGKRILQDVLEGDGGSCGSSSSSASHGGGGGKMPCLSRKINDILADRNQFQQFSAAAAAVAAAASLSAAAASANGSGAEDNNNSNDSLQFNLAGAGAGAVPEASIRTGGPVLYLPNGVLTGIDMGGSPPTAAAAAAPVMSSVAVE